MSPFAAKSAAIWPYGLVEAANRLQRLESLRDYLI
jgi:hypothetical protein